MSIIDKLNKKAIDSLNIIVVGVGNVGVAIAEQLSKEGHRITVIDKNADAVKKISETYDVLGIVGNGSSYSVLMEAGIEHADLIIAVTASDELNLLCCTIAKKVGNCAAIARVRNPDYSRELTYLRARLDISMIINPELEAAREIARLLRLPGAISINSFAKGHAELVKFKVADNSPLCGKSLIQLQQTFSSGLLVCAVEREKEVIIPKGSFVFEKGDIVLFVSTVRNTKNFFRKIGVETRRVSSVMIVGGGTISYYLTKMLLDEGISVKIIEQNPARCSELAADFNEAMIFCGDGTNDQLLLESGLMETEAFIPLTNIDEENILLTLHAKKHTDAKVITKIDRTNFHEVISGLDIDSVVYPRYITAESILAYARAKKNSLGSNIETLYHIVDDRVEAIEFRVGTCHVTDVPLMELPLKEDILIACINRNGKIIIPSGSDRILEGDTVIIVTKHAGFHDIDDILA